MKWDEVFSHTFKALRREIEPKVRKQVDFLLPSMPMIEACRANEFDFFQPFLETGKITVEQMHEACDRYFLGKTRTGRPIFWMIDSTLTPLDAHIGSGWISDLLKNREPLLHSVSFPHCLFGLHLLSPVHHHSLSSSSPVSIVESESSAVLLSLLFPDTLWMAYATTLHLTPDFLAPLSGRRVVIYPRTDPTRSTYLFFLDYADHVRRLYDIDITIDSTLEDHATEAQKERCIDLIDFLLNK